MNTRSSDVVFVFPPAHGGGFRNHLGVAYLRAALGRDGIRTAQYVCRSPGSIDAVAADIICHRSPIVGFTAYDENTLLCVALAQSIKRQKAGVRVVFGGPSATFGAQRLLERHAAIDACIRGEAEQTAKDIFAKLLGGNQFDDAGPGIAFRRGGEVVCTPAPALVGSDSPNVESALDTTLSPYLSGILTDGRAGVLTGRGCTHRCQYCCFAALARNRLRLHSTERVLAELQYIAEHQRRTGERYPVSIQDDAFTLLPSRAKTLCQAIADRNLKLALSCITRADTLDEELIRLMSEAGFVSLAFGLESAVPAVLRAAGKVRPPDWYDPDLGPEKCFLEQVKRSVVTAKQFGLHVGVSIILGLPSEAAADGAETLRFVRALPIDYYMHNLLWVFPGTPLWETHDHYRIRCAIDEVGRPTTTQYAYEVTSLRPGRRCALEQDANLVRMIATATVHECEATAVSGKGIGAVVIHGELSAQIAEYLRRVLAIGGIVIQICPSTTRRKQLARIERDRSLLDRHLVPARQHIHLHPRKNSRCQDQRWQIACAGVDLYNIHKPALLSLTCSNDASPLFAWGNGHRKYAMVCDVSASLHRRDELEALFNLVESQDADVSLGRMPVPPNLKYSSRWLIGKAPCRSLTRIEIDAEGDVRCCGHGEPIGNIGDSRRALSNKLAEFARAVEERRGCRECRNTQCPRCPFPGVDDTTYCDIMRRQERVRRFLNWMRLYARLPLLVAVEQDNVRAG